MMDDIAKSSKYREKFFEKRDYYCAFCGRFYFVLGEIRNGKDKKIKIN